MFLSSQNYRRPIPTPNESKHVHKPEEPLKGGGCLGNSSSLIQEDETTSWLQYALDESIEKELCSELFYEIPTVVGMTDTNKPSKVVASAGEKHVNFGASEEPNVLVIGGKIKEKPVFEQCSNLNFAENAMPPPKSLVPKLIPQAINSGTGRMVNFSNSSIPNKDSLVSPNDLLRKKVSGNVIQGEVGLGGSLMMSNCGSNQVGDEGNLNRVSSNGFSGAEDDRKMFFPNERRHMGALEPTVTSSSGGSRGSLGRTSKETPSNQSLKRKSRDDESESLSEVSLLYLNVCVFLIDKKHVSVGKKKIPSLKKFRI